MSDISIVSAVNGTRVEPVEVDRTTRSAARPETAARPSDRVDISDRARLLSQLAALPDTRTDLVDSIRKQIADGTYETADRLDQAVSNLLGDLDLPG